MKESTHLETIEYALRLQRRVQHLDVYIAANPMHLQGIYRYSYIVASANNKESLHSTIFSSATIDENIKLIKNWLEPKFHQVTNQSISLIGKTIYLNKEKPYKVEYIPSATHLKLESLLEPVSVSDCYTLN